MSEDNIILGLVNALAWPITVLVLALLFKSALSRVMERIGAIKWRDLVVEIDNALDKAEEKADKLKLPAIASPKKKLNEFKKEPTFWLAENFPHAAIMDAWRSVELKTIDVAKAQGIEFRGPIAGERVIKELIEKNLLDHTFLSLYRDLRTIRNNVAHSGDLPLASWDAVRYVDLSLRLLRGLDKVK